MNNRHSRNGNFKHGLTDTPTFKAWSQMRRRCLDGTHHNYPSYGGRGVTVCERWQDFMNFLADMGERPPGKTLDRFPNPDGNYEQGNCRWATPLEQGERKRNSVFIELDGRRLTASQWARETGIDDSTIKMRIFRSGWSVRDALTTPVDATCRNGRAVNDQTS